eukprot:1634509-Rhodomonas_salina.1
MARQCWASRSAREAARRQIAACTAEGRHSPATPPAPYAISLPHTPYRTRVAPYPITWPRAGAVPYAMSAPSRSSIRYASTGGVLVLGDGAHVGAVAGGAEEAQELGRARGAQQH